MEIKATEVTTKETYDIEEEEKEIIKEYLLENPSIIIDLAREISSYDGSQDWSDVWILDDLSTCIETKDLIRSIIYGDVTNVDDFVRYNAYGNLETVTEMDLENDAIYNVDSVIDDLYRLYNNIYISDDGLKELMNI